MQVGPEGVIGEIGRVLGIDPGEVRVGVAVSDEGRLLARPLDTLTGLDDRGVAGKIKKAAFDAGLICYPMSGTIDGRQGDHVLLAPPFIITDAQLDELTDKLDSAISSVI